MRFSSDAFSNLPAEISAKALVEPHMKHSSPDKDLLIHTGALLISSSGLRKVNIRMNNTATEKIIQTTFKEILSSEKNTLFLLKSLSDIFLNC